MVPSSRMAVPALIDYPGFYLESLKLPANIVTIAKTFTFRKLT